MLNVKRTRLSLAVVAALAAGLGATNAQAVNYASADKLGDGGIFQYYTANNGWQTFFRIINTGDDTVLVKVRFREAQNSREVLDFGLFLSPYDMFSFWTDPSAGGANKPGIITDDTSCVVPISTNSPNGFIQPDPSNPSKYALFKDYAYTGDYADGGAEGIERTLTGHVEFIGVARWDSDSEVEDDATHESGNPPKPPGCTQLSQNFRPGIGNPGSNQYIWRGSNDVENVLAANAYMYKGLSGFGTGYDPDILANFAGDHRRLLSEYLADPQLPDLDSADPRMVFLDEDTATPVAEGLLNGTYSDGIDFNGSMPDVVDTNGNHVNPPRPINGWYKPAVSGGVDAVSALFTRWWVANEWANRDTPAQPVTAVNTEWVLTFPTKHYYVDLFDDPDLADWIWPTMPAGDVYQPFSNAFNGGSCEPFWMWIYGREEEQVAWTSPYPDPDRSLCWETNVIAFGGPGPAQTLLPTPIGEQATVQVPDELIPGDPWVNPKRAGWAELVFSGNNANLNGLVGPQHTYFGLPVTGFMLTNLVGAEVQMNMSTIHDHKYRRHHEDNTPVPAPEFCTVNVTLVDDDNTLNQVANWGTVLSSPAGIACTGTTTGIGSYAGGYCDETYPLGTVVTLQAFANTGFTFAGWTNSTCPGAVTTVPGGPDLCTIQCNGSNGISARADFDDIVPTD